ncbi:sulfotransferase domain-containing protein [Nitratireductor sp. XY-223]|uniref:sulfotransferase domain-containing protein n=1 Tax=Nitratireductor sp. XY-223 TaxID=2561926 RepID=UPI0010AB4AFB|nr:sulfotransferase domain-containing protein [Nitratireductor sp. XY-223]
MVLSREEVIWGYRFILGRNPESDRVIDDKIRHNKTIHELRSTLLGSPEFQKHILPKFIASDTTGTPKVLIVNSHRRSGTHFLIDTLFRNFNLHGTFLEIQEVPRHKLLNKKIVVKNHAPNSRAKHIRNILDGYEKHELPIKELYILRNPYHTLRSLYYFDLAGMEPKFAVKSGIGFYDYLTEASPYKGSDGKKSRLDFYFHHYKYWSKNNNSLTIKYEQLKEDKDAVLQRIAKYIDEKIIVNDSHAIDDTSIATGITSKTDTGIWTNAVLDLFASPEYARQITEMGYEVVRSAENI